MMFIFRCRNKFEQGMTDNCGGHETPPLKSCCLAELSLCVCLKGALSVIMFTYRSRSKIPQGQGMTDSSGEATPLKNNV